MKVKQVGNINKEPEKINLPPQPPEPPPQPPAPPPPPEKIQEPDLVQEKEKSGKNKFYIYGGILIFIIAAVLYYFLVYQKSDDSSQTQVTQDELKSKELELKERELKLKELEQNKKNNTQTQIQTTYSANTPEGVAVKFIESLGKQDFSAAFALMSEKRRGNYSTFSSKKGYGGITSTKVFSCTKTGEINNKTEVKIIYESIDPINRSGKYEQYFYLIPYNDSYLINEIKNINIQYYD